MKKKLVLKPFVLPMLYLIFIVILMLYATNSLYKDPVSNDEVSLIDDVVIDDSIPVINETDVFVLNPFLGDNITETVGYYDYKGEKISQEKSIIKFENTYLQNTGITYSSDEDFKIVAIIDGEVTKIYDNELLGNIIEITHDKDLISVYQMVKDISVKVGDKVSAGDTIATSGICKINPNKSNLHFEVLKNGKTQNPKSIIGMNTKEL